MPSLRSKIFLNILRNRHLLSFRLKRRAVIDRDMPVSEFRKGVDRNHKLFGKLPDGIVPRPEPSGDIYGEWIENVACPPEKVIIYFHGGGYISGTCKAHRTHVAKVVQGSGIKAYLFEYRLAPEHPFPAALEDSVSVYKWLLNKGYSPDKIFFMGDSAGGGLCLATQLALKDKNIPLPSGSVVLSPWTDLKCSGDSYTTKLKDEPLAPTDSWTIFSEYYAAGQDRTNPWMSPLYGDSKGLPPVRIYVGEHETLFDDSTGFARKAEESGVDVRLTVGEQLFHCYPVCSPIFPEATEAMREICSFIKATLK